MNILVAAIYHVCVVGSTPLVCIDNPVPIKISAAMCGSSFSTTHPDASKKKMVPATQVIWCALNTGRTAPLATVSGN